jgi:hypothetical protein
MIRVKLEENGRTRTVTAQEVIVRNLVNAAARRDLKAILNGDNPRDLK